MSDIGKQTGGTGTDLGVIEQAAQTVRRMQANEEFDANGVRTIWHRGRTRVEMLSWENKDNTIVRQELSIFGSVVEFKLGKGVRTAVLPGEDELSAGGRPTGHTLNFSERPDPEILGYASHLLKHMKDRDFYAQHLLKEVNGAIAISGFDNNRTGVATLGAFTRQGQKLRTLSIDNPLAGGFFSRHAKLLLVIGLCAVAAIGGGVILGFALGIF